MMTPNRLEAIIEDVLNHQRKSQAGKITESLLSSTAVSFGCEFTTYWEVDSATLQLTPAIVWKSAEGPIDTLLNDTKNRTLSMSQGTAGHVWRSRRPVWTTNLLLDMCLPRSLEADFAGLRAGIWFALKTSDSVYGVIELLAPRLPAPSEELLVLIEYLGLALGRSLAGQSEGIVLPEANAALTSSI